MRRAVQAEHTVSPPGGALESRRQGCVSSRFSGVQGGGGVGGCTGVASALVHGTEALAQSRSGGIHAVHAGCSGDLKQDIRTWRPRSGFANENTLAWKADTHIGACFQRKKKHQSGFWSTALCSFVQMRDLLRCAWVWEGGDDDEGGGRKEEGRASRANRHVIVGRAKMDASSLCIKATRMQKKTLTHQWGLPCTTERHRNTPRHHRHPANRCQRVADAQY